MRDRLTILCWHNVEGSWCFPSPPGTGLRGLERQLRLLRRVADVVSLPDALGAMAAGRRISPRSVALTFDDGYRDQLDLAVPLLERLGLPATFFLVPRLLSGAMSAWWEVAGWAFTATRRTRLSWEAADLELASPQLRRDAFEAVAERLKRRDRLARETAVEELVALLDPAGTPPGAELFLDWASAGALQRGGFSVGSHSLSHAILSQESPAEQQRDLRESRRLLQEGFATPVELLAYPNGTAQDYSAATVAAAAAAGYTHALTMRSGVHTPQAAPHEVRRVGLTPLAGPREWRWSLRDALADSRGRGTTGPET